MQSEHNALWLRVMTKSELHDLIRHVQARGEEAVASAVDFFCAESFGMWHNRARAKLCRHFKNSPPSEEQIVRMVDAIVARLVEGRFSEQFKDQLRMAMKFAPKRMEAAAAEALSSEKEYVRRYGDWLMKALKSRSGTRD